MALKYRFFYLENGAKWREADTEQVSYKRNPYDEKEPRNEILAGQTLRLIKTHKRFTVFLPSDLEADFLHTLLRAITEQWKDAKAEIDLVRTPNAGKSDSLNCRVVCVR